MFKSGIKLICCFMFVVCLQQIYILSISVAAEREERVQLLQQKMENLHKLLQQMQEEKLRQQPPDGIPWQPIQLLGEERQAYYQYAYLLAPQMAVTELDDVLQQLYFFTSQDELSERTTLFVVPALPLAAEEQMSVASYNRHLAGKLLKQVGMPAALEGGLLITPVPLDRLNTVSEGVLYIDLTGCDQILRSRIFALLQSHHLFSADGSIHGYLWKLLKSAAPQAFTVHMRDELVWLELDN